MEEVYDIDVKLKISFSSKHLFFYKRGISLLYNFLDLMAKVDISDIRRCERERCGKCIVFTRKNKRFCKGCASKHKQEVAWEKDPEGMRMKERERNKKRGLNK